MENFKKRRKQLTALLMALVLCVCSPFAALAHSGRTDSSGGHKDNQNKSGLGSYHYHHGYPAHLHTDGVCPYDVAPAATPTPTAAPTVAPTAAPTATLEPLPKTTATPAPAPESEKPITVRVDGAAVEFDQPPVLHNGRVMVPVRAVAEELACDVVWDEKAGTVYLNQSHAPLNVQAVSKEEIQVYVNNEPVVFADQNPMIFNGRMLLPIRGVAEKLNCSVEWDGAALVVDITTKK